MTDSIDVDIEKDLQNNLQNNLQLSNADIEVLNNWSNFLSYKMTHDAKQFLNCDSKIRCLFTGNQRGKNAVVCFDIILRILGLHPVKKKNMTPDKKVRTFRFASETLPNDPDGGEAKNTQYPEFKKWLPLGLVKKDITMRNSVMTVRCPQGWPDVYIEFVSYSQSIQRTAGQQRACVWLDENGGKGFFEEQPPRLLSASEEGGGDLIMSYTPTPGSTGWEFDDLYEQARMVYRTQAVRDRIKLRTGVSEPPVKKLDSSKDISIFMCATDDNPTLSKENIDVLFQNYADEDVIDARRYGIFRQLGGKYHKNFTSHVHVISQSDNFPNGIPNQWKHFRGIDYHSTNPWAISFIAKSPDDEIFVYDELSGDPRKKIAYEIACDIALKSGNNRFTKDLIDPLANEVDPRSGWSMTQTLNQYFLQIKRESSDFKGAFFQGWDTKSRRGYDEVQKRLKNALIVGKPFSNEIIRNGIKEKLPTIWFMSGCKEHIDSFKNARYDEWANRDQEEKKEQKQNIIQRWSHFCMSIECLCKDMVVLSNYNLNVAREEHKTPNYFQRA